MPMSRNPSKTPDIIDHVADLRKRLKALETSRRVGFTSYDDGTLRLRGDIPEIRFIPVDDPDYTTLGSIFAFHYNADNNTTLQMDIEKIDNLGGFHQNGGKVQLYGEGAILSYFPEYLGLPEAYLWLGWQGIETIGFQGKFPVGQLSGADAFTPNAWVTGAGFTSYAYSYFATYNSTAVPIVTLHNAGGVVTWNITAFNNSSYTIAWTGTADKTLLTLVLRTNA